MKKQCLTIGIAVIFSAGLAIAQSSKNTAGPKDTQKDVKAGTVVVTGCVAQSADGKGYMLNDAIMAPRPIDKKAPERPLPSGDKMVMSYMLDGGNMKRHVGQKVEISASAIAENTMAMDHNDLGGTLKVKSVKTIASSCT